MVYICIRTCSKYLTFIQACLTRAAGKSELTGVSGQVLHVHHIISVSFLIKQYKLNKENYLDCVELYDTNNAVVLTENEHRAFHRKYGTTATLKNLEEFKHVINL